MFAMPLAISVAPSLSMTHRAFRTRPRGVLPARDHDSEVAVMSWDMWLELSLNDVARNLTSHVANLGYLHKESGQTLQGSFLGVAKPIFANKRKNTHLKALAEIYTIHSFALLSNHKKFPSAGEAHYTRTVLHTLALVMWTARRSSV